MSDPTLSPAVTQLGVPAPAAVPAPAGAEPTLAPSAEPVAQDYGKMFAEMQARMDAQTAVFQQTLEALRPQAPQPAPVAQPKTLAEMISEANLPDPALATGAEYNQALAGVLEKALEARVSQMIGPVAQKIQSFEQEQRRAQENAQMVATLKAKVPQLANIPDWQVSQALNQMNQDSALIALGGAIASMIQPQSTPTTNGVRQTQQVQPGPAADLPSGPTTAELAMLKQEYNSFKGTEGAFKAQELRATPEGQKRLDMLFQLALANGW